VIAAGCNFLPTPVVSNLNFDAASCCARRAESRTDRWRIRTAQFLNVHFLRGNLNHSTGLRV
jgi:hypothetical protein